MNGSLPCLSRALILCLLLAPLLVGCGQSGPLLFDVSGAVTYNGQPIPAGTVLFQPDASQGCSGPAGIAVIRNGRYDTAEKSGRGVVGGPHIVQVIGFDGKPVDDMCPDGEPLFPDYTITIELPKENTSHDISVPAE